MSHSTDGYVTGLDYTYDHHPDLNPVRVPLAFVRLGAINQAKRTPTDLIV